MKNQNRVVRVVMLSMALLLTSGDIFSVSADDVREKFMTCAVCHSPDINPPLAPPMWGIQRRYKNMADDKEHFIELISKFALEPKLENAIFQKAVGKMGLMPEIDMPEDDLREIAAFIWEEEFPPPCSHWEFGAESAKVEGDFEHEKKDRRKLERFCE